jgi:SAM-dependent methyltransferase
MGGRVSELISAFRNSGVPAGGGVLHLGCGRGSLDMHLKAHFRVTGIDISPAMLDHARRTNPDVEYIQGDILLARLNRRFDGVLLHDAQAYCTHPEQLRSVYETAAAHLGHEGVMVSAPEELRHRFQQDRVHDAIRLSEGTTTVTTVEIDHDPDPEDNAFDRTFLFLIRDANGQRVEMDLHRQGLWDLEDVLASIREAGFLPDVSTPKLSDMEQGEWVLGTAKRQ